MIRFKQEKPHYCGPASLRLAQYFLGYSTLMTQDEWAYVARTNEIKGTTVHHLKRCALLMASSYGIQKEPISLLEATRHLTSYSSLPVIVYDRLRDHWMAGKMLSESDQIVIDVHDPEDGFITRLDLSEFNQKYLSSKKHSYALILFDL
jgi:hypothetical protein